ncbi:NAD-dependent epimerase/dehydratase family protein [Oricola nitratireducens]|uniref:NAD-dependent epimerase/dehydratase family protein n=1 Tax=Oricola nitratireducens TaxID=2775868 RepID=UPI001866C84D|nr:NAD(P)-dependent oxidoreductase [Oricola nitratireducens]
MIFLLGGNGFVGSGFARTLRERGLPFEIITRENYGDFVGKSCDLFINANGNSKKFLAKDDPKAEFRASVQSVRDTLADFKFGTYLFLSTSDIYPDCSSPELTREDAEIDVDRQSPYGFHKYLAELCVRHAAPDWLIVRQGGFVGPGLKKNAVYDILHGDKLFVHPESRFQFIHTDDSARLVLELLDKGVRNQVVNLTGRGTASAAEIMDLAGRKLPHPADALPVRYEISTQQAGELVKLPRTFDSVRDFLAPG